jgi:hypothetical protein
MTDPVRAIADAVLYEGYVLWPYRRSALKNRQRWTFGGVYPRGWPQDRSEVSAQVSHSGTLDVSVRFLQVVHRQVEAFGSPVDEARGHLTWDEAVEREVRPGPFEITAGASSEDVGHGVVLRRSWQSLHGTVFVQDGRVIIRNDGEWDGSSREETVRRTFCSLHAVLRAEWFDTDHESRSGEGLWPVVVDDRTMLASPIILEDRPRVAPESPGDFFDGGEIDQLLVLNILALTDEEKAEMRATDPRAREILERTESLSQEQLMALHGRTVRG